MNIFTTIKKKIQRKSNNTYPIEQRIFDDAKLMIIYRKGYRDGLQDSYKPGKLERFDLEAYQYGYNEGVRDF
jgi:hypothetical protein